ncbi:endospore germination permease [Clostridium sp. P21]|uniref:Endospore germination permease n=1 Tax=Clostridium muellerianum TaxID=2716538 RepID=A0A7Y0HQF3_9CLOT|nr:endospore germination permease [Clostridium muellerianum]NMM63738.1 endospore germination permease [Clostridium muellerianum]
MNKTRITSHQLFALTVNYSCGTSIIVVSASLAGIAKQDAWICTILTPLFGLFFVWIYYYLASLYPNKSYVDIICSVFGKWCGSFISAAFVFICLLDVPQIIWYVGNFITTQSLINTPIYVVNTVIIIAVVIGVLYGIEAIARASEIFIYIVSFMLILAFILVSPNAKFQNVLPVLEKGIIPVLKGAVLLSSYTTWSLIVLNMIYPLNVSNVKDIRKPLFIGYLWGSFIIFMCNSMSILVLGSNIAANLSFPTYALAKEINVGIVFTRMEAIISASWIITLFFKALLYFYGGTIGVSQLLGLKDYKKIVLPLGLISTVFSNIVYPNSTYEAKWDSTTWVLLIGTFAVVLPIVILTIHAIKNKMRIK